MFSKLFIVMTSIALAVNAQDSSSSAASAVPSLTPCILGCISAAAVQDGCVSQYVLTPFLHEPPVLILNGRILAPTSLACAPIPSSRRTLVCVSNKTAPPMNFKLLSL